jgi:hypothetical protein
MVLRRARRLPKEPVIAGTRKLAGYAVEEGAG